LEQKRARANIIVMVPEYVLASQGGKKKPLKDETMEKHWQHCEPDYGLIGILIVKGRNIGKRGGRGKLFLINK